MKVLRILWGDRTVSERFSLLIALTLGLFWFWVYGRPERSSPSDIDYSVTVVAMILTVLLALFALPGAIAMIYWGGEDFEPGLRWAIDKILPMATLIGFSVGAGYLLQAL